MREYIDQLSDDLPFQMYALEEPGVKNERSIDLEALHELDNLAESYDSYDQPMVYIADITSIAGVLAGLKPGAIIYGAVVEGSLLDRLGLASVDSVNNNVCIAQERDVALRLCSLHKQLFSANRIGNRPLKGNSLYECVQEIGRLLGYPETAIEYYLDPAARFRPENEQTLALIRAEQTENALNRHFQHLVLSPDHYEEEVATYTQPLEDATRTLLPNTYKVIEGIAEHERSAEPYRELGMKVIAWCREMVG